MRFHCEDLAENGVILVPHDSLAFQPLCSDIRRHIETPPPGSPPPIAGEGPDLPGEDDPASAILWNHSGKPISAFTLIWRYGEKGSEATTSGTHVFGVGYSPSLLLPFGLPEHRRAFETYWHTILPHSKRYLDRNRVLGTNADVRPPAPDEQWKGGVMRWGGTRPPRQLVGVDRVTLILDAAFFSTGECLGPDTKQLWERVVVDAEMHQEIATVARRGVEAGFDVEQILADIEQITAVGGHPPPPPPPPSGQMERIRFRERARWRLADTISHMRTNLGNDKTVAVISDWVDAEVPKYRRS
jgi:hypothetical protein